MSALDDDEISGNVEFHPEPTAEFLLEWMGCHNLPLELFREEETQLWVVVDTAAGCVLASGEMPLDALSGAHNADAMLAHRDTRKGER